MKLKTRKQKHCFASMVIAMIATSLATVSVPVFSADGDVTFDLTYYYPGGIVPGAPPGSFVTVDVYVDASALTPELGMVGWGLYVTVDPAVLTPVSVYGADAGYFLYDWCVINSPGSNPKLLLSVGVDYIECSEFPLPLPPTGATGVGRLCTLYFESQSETAYSPLIIASMPKGGYQDITGARYETNAVNGHYNLPKNAYQFEQFAGSTWPTGDPIGSDWHELEPVYCMYWWVDSWIDNGDGFLSPSDQIAMMPEYQETTWFRVQWLNPAPVAGDGIVDLFVTGPTPLASFRFSPAKPVVNESVIFDASASIDFIGSIVSWDWGFGDGSVDSGEIVSHAYVAAGYFTVNLIVTDNDGLTDTATKLIRVAEFSSIISISASPTTITIGESITINGSITPTRPGATVTLWCRLSGEETWGVIGNVTTDGNSQYSYMWTPEATGTYEVKASWEGDSNTADAESDMITTNTYPAVPEFPLDPVASVALIVAVAYVWLMKKRERPRVHARAKDYQIKTTLV